MSTETKPRRDLVAERTRSTLSRAFSDTVLTHLLADGRYRLPGFGTFTLRMRPARQVRNPQTKELMWLPSTPEVRFRAAKRLKRGVTARLSARYPKEALREHR